MITPLPGYKVDPTNPNGVVPIVPGTSPAVAQQPVVAPGTAPQTGSLQNTMTTPTVPTPATPTVTSNPAVPQAPAQGLPQGQFGALLGQVQQNLQNNNNLISQRQLLLKHLFDAPLTPDQLAKLPPDQQSIINAGDKNAIELQVRVLNDQLQGRANSLSSSVKYLTDAYKTDIDTAEKKKQDAIDNVIKFAQAYGSQAGTALKSLYGDTYLSQLKDLGVDINAFTATPTLAETKTGNASTGTAQERADQAMSDYADAFVPGAKLKDGAAVIDSSGFITPVAWKKAISSLPKGVSRDAFIKRFGHLLYGSKDKDGNYTIDSSYGLTPVEIKLITGAL